MPPPADDDWLWLGRIMIFAALVIGFAIWMATAS
jgi:hypothetical protein